MIIDLSLPIKNNTHEPDSPRIKYFCHVQGARKLINGAILIIIKKNFLRGLLFCILSLLKASGIPELLKIRLPAISFKDFPGGMGLANEELLLDTHAGTHLDAPWHFGPELAGKKSRTIDGVPLEWCFSDGVVLDLRSKKSGELIGRLDIEAALTRINYSLRPCDIVLIMTGADKYFYDAGYFYAHPGMSAEATVYLIEKGIKIIGIDGWGFDRPAMAMLSEYLSTGNNRAIFPAHMVGRKYEYCHIEKLANLDKIPRPYGFKVACFPIKVENAGAGWCRAVAII